MNQPHKSINIGYSKSDQSLPEFSNLHKDSVYTINGWDSWPYFKVHLLCYRINNIDHLKSFKLRITVLLLKEYGEHCPEAITALMFGGFIILLYYSHRAYCILMYCEIAVLLYLAMYIDNNSLKHSKFTCRHIQLQNNNIIPNLRWV